MDTTYLFCYGTLMKGFGNSYLLDHADFIGPAKSLNRYFLKADVIPYLFDIPNTIIKGELYRLDARILRSVDKLEGHPILYTRKVIPVAYGIKGYSAYCYFANISPESAVILEDGDFRRYRNEGKSLQV